MPIFTKQYADGFCLFRGQQLMDQLQNSNPEIVDQLRRVARGQADPSTDQPPTDNPNGS